MALTLKEKPVLIDGSNAVEELTTPGIDVAVLMWILEEMESQCEDQYCNEEQVNSMMESLEAEIRMASGGSCSMKGDIGSNGSFEWAEMEMVPSSPSDDMNCYVEDLVEMPMDGYLVQFGNDFPLTCYKIQSENGFSANLWQETYDTAIYN